jgi:plasmid stabilization system protein ParE
MMWSDRAITDMKNIIDYLTKNWTRREIQNFSRRLDKRLDLISVNPNLFPRTTKRKNVRKSVLTKHTVIYYKTESNVVTIVTLFDPRQNPKRLRL